jgi:AraC-type transcriptional regulator N-terminus
MIGSARAWGGEHGVGIEEIRKLIATHAHKEDLGLPGVLINKVTDPTRPTPAVAEPILAFLMQGAKRIALADSVYDQVND